MGLFSSFGIFGWIIMGVIGILLFNGLTAAAA